MRVFLKEIGWHRQHGKNDVRIDQRIIEDLREKVDNRSHFEVHGYKLMAHKRHYSLKLDK